MLTSFEGFPFHLTFGNTRSNALAMITQPKHTLQCLPSSLSYISHLCCKLLPHHLDKCKVSFIEILHNAGLCLIKTEICLYNKFPSLHCNSTIFSSLCICTVKKYMCILESTKLMMTLTVYYK